MSISEFTSWPAAFAIVGIAVMISLTVISLIIALNGNRFPWEKD